MQVIFLMYRGCKKLHTHADSYSIRMITFNGTQHNIINMVKLITSNGNCHVMMPIMHPIYWQENMGVGGEARVSTFSAVFFLFLIIDVPPRGEKNKSNKDTPSHPV